MSSLLRACLVQAPRSVASSSSSSAFHTSSLRLAALNNASKKLNNARRAVRDQKAVASRPSVILGTRPGEEHKWLNCDLCKIVITEEQIADKSAADPDIDSFGGKVLVPKLLAHGIGSTRERSLLFESLPALSAEAATQRYQRVKLVDNPARLANVYRIEEEKELDKANTFAKLIDLRNANAKGIAYENRRRIVEAFSEPGKPGDTGRAEVQAALFTLQIRNLWDHLKKNKRDVGNRRGLRMLVHKRAKVLKFLKKMNRRRYDICLERLGLEPESVEGELVV